MERNLEKLREDYKAGLIVPFIGSGFSAPFKIPTWEDLILELVNKYVDEDKAFIRDVVTNDLKRNDYWKAIDNLKHYADVIEEEIQETVVAVIKEKQITSIDDSLHNYNDLKKLTCNLYLTTNYENLLNKYLQFENQPICLRDLKFSTQNLFLEKRICQLHGTSSNPGTIVLSKESYEELYRDKKYDDLLKLVTGTKKILFMGFSFNDQFIKTLIKQHRQSFNGEHYIILNNPSAEQIKELKTEYRLNTITYDQKNSTHVLEIRKILQDMCSDHEIPSETELENIISTDNIVVGAGVNEFEKKLDGNLFYRKLVLEQIDEEVVELSSDFYIAADQYIREMKKMGMPIQVIEAILGQVLLEYKQNYINVYKKYGKSEEFLNVVHESLEKLDFVRYKEILKNNISNKYENKGFVHLLADDESKEIWWGKGRFDGI